MVSDHPLSIGRVWLYHCEQRELLHLNTPSPREAGDVRAIESMVPVASLASESFIRKAQGRHGLTWSDTRCFLLPKPNDKRKFQALGVVITPKDPEWQQIGIRR